MNGFDELESAFAEMRKFYLMITAENHNDVDVWFEYCMRIGNIESFAFMFRRTCYEHLVEKFPDDAMGWYYFSEFLYYKSNLMDEAYLQVKNAVELLHKNNKVSGAVTNHFLKLSLELKAFEQINSELRYLLLHCPENSNIPLYFFENILPNMPPEHVDESLISELKLKFCA